ncbi:MAG: adenosylmethionine decarboxylase [Deltaproteobacteria bacterium]|nr:adenosylmethionine decarboxylase [Deltaproteobacteria bacterium]
MSPPSLGKHFLLDFFGCDPDIINNATLLREILLEAARRGKASIITDVFHRFSPHGVSGVIVIAESHIAVHTWPEHESACVDMFTCSEKMKPEVIESFLKDTLRAKEVMRHEIQRGRDKWGPREKPAQSEAEGSFPLFPT